MKQQWNNKSLIKCTCVIRVDIQLIVSIFPASTGPRNLLCNLQNIHAFYTCQLNHQLRFTVYTWCVTNGLQKELEEFLPQAAFRVCTVKQFSYFDYSVDGHYRERNGPESPMAQVNTSHVFNPAPLRNQVQQTRDLDNRQSRTASTATKELDDLMASLSDFKVNVSTAPTPSQSRLSGDYAKPTKSKQQLPCMW